MTRLPSTSTAEGLWHRLMRADPVTIAMVTLGATGRRSEVPAAVASPRIPTLARVERSNWINAKTDLRRLGQVDFQLNHQ